MGAVEKHADGALAAAVGWEYAPSPEARDIVSLRGALRPLHRRRGGRAALAVVVPDDLARRPRSRSPRSRRRAPRTSTLAVKAARDGVRGRGASCEPAERAKYLFRIARVLQERARELAVAESLDGGKPIKESRDVDLPLAAAHFFYYAGWADKLEYAFPGRKPRPLGVAAQIIPWNFPLLMLAWKIAPALACGNTVVLKPAETTPLTALLFADVCRQAELPPGVVNIVTGDGSTGAHLVQNPAIDKVAFTGSTEVGKAIQRELAGRGIPLTLELGGKAANIVFDDCALDQAVEGIVNGIYFNQGHVCCAGSRLLVQESIHDQLVRKLKRRMATLRVGDPLDKNTDVGAINSKAQLERIRELVASGEEEGAEIYQPPCRLPEKGWWFAPTVFTNVAQSYRIAREEIFGPVLSVLTFRTPDEAVEKANNTMYGLSAGDLDGEGLAHPLDGRPAARRRRVGQHVQPLRPRVAVRRLQGVGLRPRGRAARARGVPEVRVSAAASRPEDLQALHRRRVPALRVGSDATSSRATTSRARRARTRATRSVAARKGFAAWSAATAYNRGQVLYRLAETMETRAGALAAVCSGRREVARAIDRVVWYAGWADKLAQVLGSSNPVAGPYFNFTIPEPTGVVAVVAPDEPALDGLVARVVPALVGGNAVVVAASEIHPLAAIELAEAIATSDVPDGVVNVLTGLRAELAPVLAAHMDVNAIDVTGADGDAARSRCSRPRTSNASCGRARISSPWEIAAFMEMKTVWHPIGR